ncbi:MAG: hypothetical protein IPM71_12045 [Bacteroidota bacterium]|nr:MAG: hypothetical protein IPM71_12045 [Bacteroidota bacterium]
MNLFRYKQLVLKVPILSLLLLFSCDDENERPSTDNSNTIYGTEARGEIPISLESVMHVGIFENRGLHWMENSGVPWNSGYIYLVPGWADNWGLDEFNGNMAFDFMNECDRIGAVPVFEFYLLAEIEGGGEEYDKTTNASTMKRYFEEYMLLLSRIKEFGKPVIILVEADGFAMMQQQTGGNPNAYSAVEDTGIPELSGLPNTLAGWGLAFLELKKTMGVDKLSLGIHVSAWATGNDISYYSTNIPLQPEVDETYNFLAPLGLTPNQTGLEFDFLVGDPSDRDADYYQVVLDTDKWWDTDTAASINSKSFNRYAEWLRLWNIKAGKRWILWQIAMGNEYHLNVANNGGPQQGYKDNRVEYFLGDNSAYNLAKFANCGVIALLFGQGAPDQASFENDQDNHGNLYLKSRASEFYNRGGMKLKR